MLRALVFAGLALPIAVGARAAQCSQYEPAIVHLRGTIEPTMLYGPPNFGEDPKTDSKGIYAVLVLDKSLCVAGDNNSDNDQQSERNVSKMQMVFFDKYPFHKKWNDQRVQVTGKLFHADNAFHHTNVLIMVDRVSALGSYK